MDFDQIQSGLSWLVAAVLCFGMWQCAWDGQAWGAAVCGQAACLNVWYAMHKAHHARQAWQEFKVDCVRELVGSLLPKGEDE